MRLQLAPEFISAAYCCYTHVRNIKSSRKTMRPQGYLTLYLVILLFSVIAISSAQNGTDEDSGSESNSSQSSTDEDSGNKSNSSQNSTDNNGGPITKNDVWNDLNKIAQCVKQAHTTFIGIFIQNFTYMIKLIVLIIPKKMGIQLTHNMNDFFDITNNAIVKFITSFNEKLNLLRKLYGLRNL